MIEIAAELRRWCADGRRFALAMVTGVEGSAPRGAGACVAVDAEGQVLGSISGGCVEGAVYDLALEALGSGEVRRASFGYSDSDAFAVGLSCGGTLEVLVRPVVGIAHTVLTRLLDALAEGRPVALATVTDGPRHLLGAVKAITADDSTGTLRDALLDLSASRDSRALLTTGRDGTHRYESAGGCDPATSDVTVLTTVYATPPRMLIYGAIDFASAMSRTAKLLGYHVTVCDAREVFTTTARFPDADEVVVDWPHRHLRALADRGELDGRTAICVLTHDAKFDLPLLEVALRLPVGYVGAMGSRRTDAQRRDNLRTAGLGLRELARLHSPIGLDIGATTPEETAVSIAAEIIAARTGAPGNRLKATSGPIHPARSTNAAVAFVSAS